MWLLTIAAVVDRFWRQPCFKYRWCSHHPARRGRISWEYRKFVARYREQVRLPTQAASLIGGDATLLFHADSASIGGVLDVTISDSGGTIDGNALVNFGVTHDITVQDDATSGLS